MTENCAPQSPDRIVALEGRPPAESSSRYAVPLVCVLLVAAVAVVFGQTVQFDFNNFDDDLYVWANPHVTHGLSANEIGWAFTHCQACHWLPLVWISYMLDSQCYGLWPGGYHLTNVVLHACTSVLLFLVLKRFTGALWSSAVVAAVFAVHPLRVESVAWVTERKDVLSGLFFMLTLAAYFRYVQQPGSLLRYVCVVACYVLGLMAKPMLVTLPFVLLLLDYWPLGRLQPLPGTSQPNTWAMARRLLVEKIPLFVLSAAICALTIVAARREMASLDTVPWGLRLANLPVSYTAYLCQMLWPARLAVAYPLPPDGYPGLEVIAASILLAAISGAAVLLRRSHSYLLVGWCWYLGMLVPVSGLFQAGEQARADRFTYLPQIGIYLAIVWGIVQILRSRRFARWAGGAAAVLVVAGLMLCAWRQTAYWRDSETLWARALACTCCNAIAHNHLGLLRVSQGRIAEGIEQFRRALSIRPDHPEAHNNLGAALQREGRFAEAIEQYRQALRWRPDHPEITGNLGAALVANGHIAEGIEQYRKALRTLPGFSAARLNLGIALVKAGRPAEAVAEFEEVVRTHHQDAEAHFELARALASLDRVPEAVGHYRDALRIKPDYAHAHIELGILLATTNRLSEAVQQFDEALRIQPDDARVHVNLGIALTQAGRFREAIEHFGRALPLMPDHAGLHRTLAWLLATRQAAEGGDPVRAVELAQRACALTGQRDAVCLDTLAAAYAAVGRFAEAVATAREALRQAEAANLRSLADDVRARLELYRAGRAYHEPAREHQPSVPD